MEANLNFLPALINLSIFDAIDEIYHRCDSFFNRTDYPLILTSLNTSTLSQPYYQSYLSCYTNNIRNYLSANHLQYTLEDDIVRKIAYPFDAYKPWILPVASIGLFFACLNIRLYMKKKGLRTTFGTLALLQSIATIVFFGFVIGVVFCYYAKFGLFGIIFTLPDWLVVVNQPAWSYFSHIDRIPLVTIMIIQFYKALFRLPSLARPIWFHSFLRNWHIFLLIFISSSIVVVFMAIVVFKLYGIFPYQQPELTCINNLLDSPFYITSWTCVPDYVTYPGDFFGLCFVVVIFDIVTLFLYKHRAKHLSQEARQAERSLTRFILIDLCYISFSIARYLISIASKYQTSGNWFRYNSRMGGIITAIYAVSRHQIDGWRPIFAMLEMITTFLFLCRLSNLDYLRNVNILKKIIRIVVEPKINDSNRLAFTTNRVAVL